MKTKNIRDGIVRKIPIMCYLDGLCNIKKVKICLNDIDKMSNLKMDGLEIHDMQQHIKDIKRFIWAEPDKDEVVREYFRANIKTVTEKFSMHSLKKEDVILVCVVKNDLERIKIFMQHYVDIGINYFAFIDNLSNDGTREFLLQQENTNVYLVEDKYTTARREAWLNRLYSYIGYNHWILCVDSDELLYYIGCENNNIKKYLNLLQKKRAKALLVDMYANRDVLTCKNSSKDSIKEYRYFDACTYTRASSYRLDLIHGGPRKRIFSVENKQFNCTLTKYPLFFYEPGDFQGSSHYLYPYKKNYSKGMDVFFVAL